MIKDDKTFSSFYLYNEHKELSCRLPHKIFIQYKKHRINLLNGKKTKEGAEKFIEELSLFKVEDYVEKPIVIHLFFEMGYLFNELEELAANNKPLAIYIEYSESEIKDIYKHTSKDSFSFDGITIPSFKDYSKKFDTIYRNLVDGNCYQVNLTIPIILRMSEFIDPKNILSFIWRDSLKIGAYSHGTYCHALDKFFLSNSPECLFQIKSNNDKAVIQTFPIKGTVKVSDDKDREEAWKKLIESKKDQAELFMITDLMRNDLSRINFTAAKVTYKKCPLNVPGLIHQFSIVETEIDKSTSMKNILSNIFPGGSITGAPKKKVLEIINDVEGYKRGFYCGSTLLMFQDKKSASINIRSAEIAYTEKEVIYGSGGGVTLLSDVQDEFDETVAKFKSFLSLWGKQN